MASGASGDGHGCCLRSLTAPGFHYDHMSPYSEKLFSHASRRLHTVTVCGSQGGAKRICQKVTLRTDAILTMDRSLTAVPTCEDAAWEPPWLYQLWSQPRAAL